LLPKCCNVAVAQINYPSFKHNTQDSIEQARGRSHEKDLSQIFILDDMQFGGGLDAIKQNLIKSKNYQENKPWLQAHIHLRKSELIMETKHQFIF